MGCGGSGHARVIAINSYFVKWIVRTANKRKSTLIFLTTKTPRHEGILLTLPLAPSLEGRGMIWGESFPLPLGRGDRDDMVEKCHARPPPSFFAKGFEEQVAGVT